MSLTIATSYRPIRLFVPPPARTAYFSSARRPGVVLRVSSTIAPVPSSASTQRRVWVATPDARQTRLSSVRSAISSTWVDPVMRASTVAALDGRAVAHQRLEHRHVDLRAARHVGQHHRDHRQAGQHAVGAGDHVHGAPLLDRDGGLAGDVATGVAAEVLGDDVADHGADPLRGQVGGLELLDGAGRPAGTVAGAVLHRLR